MIVFPNCKINLGLHIVSKRADGYHNLETIFYPIPLHDVLEAVPAANDKTTITISGNTLPGDTNNNSCLKAYSLLKKDFPQLPDVSLHLHKAIPAGAGLGGGSADGAFTLQLLNNYFSLGISQSQLINYALQLGSDCPFFVVNKPCLGTGRGEHLKEVNISLKDYKIVVVNPGIHIDTGWAFSKITPATSKISLTETITKPIIQWKDLLKNDFELPVFEQYPEIGQIKQTLYNQGAVYAAMSGSGSSVFGIFKNQTNNTDLFPPHYFVKQV